MRRTQLTTYFRGIFYNSSLNPAVEDQAIARAHRIGQTNDVDVYRFISIFDKTNDTSVTLDEYCMEVQKKKRNSKNVGIKKKTEKKEKSLFFLEN